MNTPDKASLQKQYEIVMQEYRFQVQLNWDRAKHFLVFNTAILAGAVALYRNGSTWASKVGVAAMLLLAAANSLVGQDAVAMGHEYYRSICDLKTRLEAALELTEFAIVSTPGMQRAHAHAAAGTRAHGKHRWRKITAQVRGLLLLIFALSGLGAVYAGWEAARASDASPSPGQGASARPLGSSLAP